MWKKLKNLWPTVCCRSCSHGWAPLKLLSCVALINHSIMTSVWLQPRRDVWGMQCLSTSPGAPVNRIDGGGGGVGRRRWVETSGQLRGQTWDSECSLMQRRRYLRSDGCGIREPDIFSHLEISRQDEISKWSTCLKMHGIPQGWAKATGYKSSTLAPGVKTGRECDT